MIELKFIIIDDFLNNQQKKIVNLAFLIFKISRYLNNQNLRVDDRWSL